MKIATGVDLIEIDRIQAVIARHGERYLKRVYTSIELKQSESRPESLAVRFAAKEAVSKALGCGIGEIGFLEIEVLSDEAKAPTLRLSGAAASRARTLGLTEWSISLSHSLNHAIAMVVAIGE